MYAVLLVFIANFVNVFVRAFQQRNVAHLHYKWVIPTSAMFALGDMIVISSVAMLGPSPIMWLALALGGGLGCLASMKVHEKLVKHKSVVPITNPSGYNLVTTTTSMDSAGARGMLLNTSLDTERKEGQRT